MFSVALDYICKAFIADLNFSITGSQVPPSCQCCFWLSQFPKQVTDGHTVYLEMKNSTDQYSKQSNGEPVTFQRISPKSDESQLFKIDSLDIPEMIEVITREAIGVENSIVLHIFSAKITLTQVKKGVQKF